MTQKFAVFPVPLKIRYKGLYDLEAIYRAVYNWAVKRGFRYHETRYKNKAQNVRGNELKLKVWGEKEVTEYYKYQFNIYYHAWESKEVPVIVDGKQKMMMKGRIFIQINGQVITDWQERYKGTKVREFMQKFLNDIVLKYDIGIKHIDPFDKDLHRLEAEIKKLLKVEAQASGVL